MRSGAFSLVELLVVIGILAALLAVLLPAISKARKASRSTVCLSHLRQWGQAFHMYLDQNRGQSFHTLEIHQHLGWWELLGQYNGNVRATLLCPSTSGRGIPDSGGNFGSASTSWWVRRGDYQGSYGLNHWIIKPPIDAQNPSQYIRFPALGGDRVPLMGDCCWPYSVPIDNDVAPRNLGYPEDGYQNGTAGFCIDRHHHRPRPRSTSRHSRTGPLEVAVLVELVEAEGEAECLLVALNVGAEFLVVRATSYAAPPVVHAAQASSSSLR